MNDHLAPAPVLPTRLADFPDAVGLTVVGEWLQVDPERTQQFYVGTYLDLSYGETIGDGYPDGLIEGFNVLALLDWMSADMIGRWHGYNYGLDRVRFTTPVTVHDHIRLRLHVSEVRRRGAGFLVTFDATIEIRGSDRPGMVAVWLLLLLPHPPLAVGRETHSGDA